MQSDFNLIELAQAVKRKIDHLGISQRRAADECGINASTFSRIICAAGKPDIENIYKICAWLNMPFERFTNGQMERVYYYDSKEKLEIIINLIKSDQNLPEENKEKFIEIFSETYKQFTRLQV